MIMLVVNMNKNSLAGYLNRVQYEIMRIINHKNVKKEEEYWNCKKLLVNENGEEIISAYQSAAGGTCPRLWDMSDLWVNTAC